MHERKKTMATYIKTKNRVQAQVRLQGIKLFKTFPDKKSAPLTSFTQKKP